MYTITAEDDFGSKLLRSFKQKDELLFVSLYPTNEEYSALLQEMLQKNMEGLTQQKIDEMMRQRKAEFDGYTKNIFTDLLRQADSVGISWPRAVLEKFDFDAMYPGDFSKLYLNGDICISADRQHYKIAGIEAVETCSGYKLQSIRMINKTKEIN